MNRVMRFVVFPTLSYSTGAGFLQHTLHLYDAYVPSHHQCPKSTRRGHDQNPENEIDGRHLKRTTSSKGVADPVGEHGPKDAPKVETSHKQFALDIRQSQIGLDETSRMGADTNVVAEIARIQGRAEGKDYRGFRDLHGGGIEVSVVLPLVAFVGSGSFVGVVVVAGICCHVVALLSRVEAVN